MSEIDTTQTIHVAQHPGKMIILFLGAVAFTVGSIYVAFHVNPDEDPRVMVVYLGIVFFGACSLLIAHRILKLRGPVVTISPEGITDLRVAARTVPWHAIHGISTWSQSGQKVMVLAVDPAVEATLGLSRIARWSRKANAALGADGLCIAASGLAMPYDDLLQTTIAYAAKAQQDRSAT